jgi:hypothetical protein
VSNEVSSGLFQEIFIKVDMNIIALETTSTTVLLAAVIQSAHPTDARGSTHAGMGQGRVADNFSVKVNGCGYTPTPLYVFTGC